MLTVLTLAVQIIASLASPVDASALNNKRTDPLPLKTLATNKGKYFGTSILSPWFANPTYASTETAQFGQITPDNEMKFGHIHPGQNTWNFTGSDLVCRRETSADVGHGPGEETRGARARAQLCLGTVEVRSIVVDLTVVQTGLRVSPILRL